METYHTDNYVLAKSQAQSFLEKIKSEDESFLISKTNYLLGYLCSHTNDFGNAVIYYLEGSRYAKKSNRPDLKDDLISMYKNLGLILGDYNHFRLSHKFINEALKVANETNNTWQVISLLDNRMHEYLSEGRYADVINLFDSLKSNFDIPEDQLLSITNKAGIAYKESGEMQKALNLFKSILTYNSEISPKTYTHAIENIGIIKLDQKNYTESIQYLKDALIRSKEEQDNRLTIEILSLMGNVYYQQDNFKMAIQYYAEGIDLLSTGGQQPYFYEIYKSTSNCFLALNNLPKALEYEQIYSEELEKFIAQQQEIEETDKKYNIQLLTDRYFDLLAADEAQQQVERNATISIIGLCILFISVISGIYYKQIRTRQSIRRKLLEIDFNSEV